MSKERTSRAPDRPAISESQKDEESQPIGVTSPTPVMVGLASFCEKSGIGVGGVCRSGSVLGRVCVDEGEHILHRANLGDGRFRDHDPVALLDLGDDAEPAERIDAELAQGGVR